MKSFQKCIVPLAMVCCTQVGAEEKSVFHRLQRFTNTLSLHIGKTRRETQRILHDVKDFLDPRNYTLQEVSSDIFKHFHTEEKKTQRQMQEENMKEKFSSPPLKISPFLKKEEKIDNWFLSQDVFFPTQFFHQSFQNSFEYRSYTEAQLQKNLFVSEPEFSVNNFQEKIDLLLKHFPKNTHTENLSEFNQLQLCFEQGVQGIRQIYQIKEEVRQKLYVPVQECKELQKRDFSQGIDFISPEKKEEFQPSSSLFSKKDEKLDAPEDIHASFFPFSFFKEPFQKLSLFLQNTFEKMFIQTPPPKIPFDLFSDTSSLEELKSIENNPKYRDEKGRINTEGMKEIARIMTLKIGIGKH
jgi:hypothetical protein